MQRTPQNSFSKLVLLNERTSTILGSERFRYGFQNQENDDDIKGDGNSVNYKYRMHDPRLGRFFAVDPLSKDYPELTPYQFSCNSTIYMVEIEGLEGRITVITKWYTDDGLQKSKVKTYTVEGLKVDLIKVCWKGYNDPNGPVMKLDYFGRREDGTATKGCIKGVDPDAKPTVKELNTFFNNPENSFAINQETKKRIAQAKANEHWYDGTIFAPGAMEGGDDVANTGNNSEGRQAPGPIKAIAGLNPLVSVPNAIKVLSCGEDIYGESANTKLDKAFAVMDIVSLGGGFSKILKAVKASEKAVSNAKKVDKVIEGAGIIEDAGGFDELK